MSVIPHYPYTLNINNFHIRKAYARRDSRKITDFTDFTDRLRPTTPSATIPWGGLQSASRSPEISNSPVPTFSFAVEALADGRFDICCGPVRCFEGRNANEWLSETAGKSDFIQTG